MLEKKYDFNTVEKGKYEFWKENKYFECGDLTKKPFCVVIPPPNVTGVLHLGHALNNSIQDVIVRYKRMCGFDCLWLPGMDHAAIATEAKVVARLKEEGKTKDNITREEFLNECWKWTNEHKELIHKQWETLGVSVDYTHERFTLDEGLNTAVNTVFIDLYNKGYIYRGEKIINWDTIAKTALSNEEVIYKEEKSKLYYLKYKLIDGNDYITVATTRPETIFGDVAVAVNPKDKKNASFIGTSVYVPYVNRIIKVIGDSKVLIDFGTGALKITPAHSQDDFEIGQRHNLEIINCLYPDGTLNEVTKEFNHLTVDEARKKIVDILEKENLIVKIEDYTHSVGHSERTNAVVEPYLSKQWFVKMDAIADNLIKSQKDPNTKVNFIPHNFEKILNHWMEDCHDWCISRQLVWGHRIPVWYKEEEIYVGLNPPNEDWIQDKDVLDTWFSSALWPFSTLGWPQQTEELKRYFPTDLLVTAYDIIFFWVARMCFSSIEQMNIRPFKDCIIHGLIRDKDNRKMSKSLGNGIDPNTLIDKYGTDALRFYLTTTSKMGSDIRFDEEKLSSTWNFINKLWNASRYVLMNIEEINEDNLTFENLSIEDKWILTKLNETIKEVRKSLNTYRLNDAGSSLYNFTWGIFCDWYIEFSKRTQNSLTTKSVLYLVLSNILKLLHPFMPFVTEELYNSLPIKENKSIMITPYPLYNKKNIFKEETIEIDELIENITNIRNFRVYNNIPKACNITLNIKEELKETLLFMLRLNTNTLLSNNTKTLDYSSPLLNISFKFDYNDNKDEVINNLKEERNTLLLSIEKREKLLSNTSYTLKAPKNVVEIDRLKLEKEQARLKIIEDTLNQI
ncbi:MAG: valine--tRNA ligase [Bacilli bacterium]